MIRTRGASSSAIRKAVQHSTADAAGHPNLRQKRVSELLEAIASGQPCSLERLASEFNLSKSHLQHLFKQQTGLRLGHTIIDHRLDRAAQLLESTNLRIKEIAGAVGYEHTSSFVRAFERRFMRPPQAYRLYGDHRQENK
jgi:transcriptional regulator GlxA family with amidase domain